MQVVTGVYDRLKMRHVYSLVSCRAKFGYFCYSKTRYFNCVNYRNLLYWGMRVQNKEKLDTFSRKHPAITSALNRWVTIVEAANWKNPTDVKSTFGVNVDFVGKQVVFDVGGNKARIIAKTIYGVLQIVNITHVLDHADYDKKKWME
jgi:mRNA interferase HigB